MNINDFWSNDYLKTKEIEVKDFGKLTITELSALDLDDMRKFEGSELRMAAHSVIRGSLNEEGKRLFADKDLDKLLKTVSAAVLVDISTAIITLSGMNDDPKV